MPLIAETDEHGGLHCARCWTGTVGDRVGGHAVLLPAGFVYRADPDNPSRGLWELSRRRARRLREGKPASTVPVQPGRWYINKALPPLEAQGGIESMAPNETGTGADARPVAYQLPVLVRCSICKTKNYINPIDEEQLLLQAINYSKICGCPRRCAAPALLPAVEITALEGQVARFLPLGGIRDAKHLHGSRPAQHWSGR